ncbi:MAG: GPR endopeptidase [Oscillospiraceae bacterium]|nr:GPR endopeptidase [Oscillospiraceae bacterium]
MANCKRTDLAMESREMIRESAKDTSDIEGVEAREYDRNGCRVIHVKILNEKGAQILEKPVGSYVTIEVTGLMRREQEAFGHAVCAVAEEMKHLMSPDRLQGVLLAGLGNRDITPDAIGPKVMQSCIVTRHLVDKMPDEFGHMRPVAAIIPGVLGTTGMESAEIIKGAIDSMKPQLVVIVDALTSRRASRLCSTVQISDSGIVPGSGVGNARAALNHETLGVPVISVGVPTVHILQV